jgi:alanine racemase
MSDLASRPTYLEVNLPRLRANLENIRSLVAPARVLVVLKANAYGHGVDGLAPFIAPFADYIGVALVEEAVHLRRLGVSKPILVMGGTLPGQVPVFLEHDLTLAASSIELLSAAEDAAAAARTRLKVHLKMDTGMERIGVREYEAGPFLEKSLACRNLDIEGIFSHFANSEAADLVHARLQLERFMEILDFYEKRSLAPPLRHLANSAAVLQMPDSFFDMVRPGLLFYGVYPVGVGARPVEVEPALTWRSKVAFSKMTLPGRPVSYGSLWESDHPVRIVTVPCGYADGYFRRMTNRARVIVNGASYPQVGRICMDQFMVNLEGDEAGLGDEVILLGAAASGASVRAEDLAEWAGTNEYEVLTSISARVPRLFVEQAPGP